MEISVNSDSVFHTFIHNIPQGKKTIFYLIFPFEGHSLLFPILATKNKAVIASLYINPHALVFLFLCDTFPGKKLLNRRIYTFFVFIMVARFLSKKTKIIHISTKNRNTHVPTSNKYDHLLIFGSLKGFK